MSNRLRALWIICAVMLSWLTCTESVAAYEVWDAWTHDEQSVHVHPGLAVADDVVFVEEFEEDAGGGEPPVVGGLDEAPVTFGDVAVEIAVRVLDDSAPPTGPPGASSFSSSSGHTTAWSARGPPSAASSRVAC